MITKRGQVSLFIILGVIILFIAGIAFYILSRTAEEKIGIAEPKFESLPSEFEPIRSFTNDCVLQMAERGLVKMGRQGGYAYPELTLTFNEKNPTDSDGVVFSEGSDLKIPYYYFNKRKNEEADMFFTTNAPTKSEMEHQLEFYLKNELHKCLDYSDFAGYEVVQGDVETIVNILPGKVRIAADIPLEIKLDSTEVRIRGFYAESDIDILRMYELAQKITAAQTNATFLESNLLNVLPLFSRKDDSILPPMTGTSFKFVSDLYWERSDVEENLKKLIMYTTPLLRQAGSDNIYNPVIEEEKYQGAKQKVLTDMILPLDGAEGLAVTFDYLDWWEPYIDMNDNSGKIEPEGFGFSFAGVSLGVQRFNTVYDISYPIVVRLVQGGNNPFTFQFAHEVNIRDNKPASNDTVHTPVYNFAAPTLFCDSRVRNSGNITVAVRDGYTNELVPDAIISFAAGETSCTIGMTDEKGVLVSQFPISMGGQVIAIKQGYVASVVSIDTKLDTDDSVEMKIMRTAMVNLTIGKKRVVKCEADTCYVGGIESPLHVFDSNEGWQFLEQPMELAEYETGVGMLERLEGGISAAAISQPGQRKMQASLAPGTYKINIQLLADKELIIPEKTQKIIGEKVTIPLIQSPQFLSGGLFWENNETYWRLTPEMLYNSNEIMLYAVSPSIYDIPEDKRVIDDMGQIDYIDDYSIKYREELEPTIK